MTDAGPAPARIVATDWGWRFDDRAAPALAHVDLVVEPGERVLLLGASGGGKSTLLAGIAGVLDDQIGGATGALRVDGADPREVRGRVGLVLQDPSAQAVHARVGDDVAFGCEMLGVRSEAIPGRVREALDAVGLRVPLDASTTALSGGQQQRLALAGVLAMRPGLIALDEPTANLDPEGVRHVHDAVARVVAQTGATLVVVEHRAAVWRDLVDRVVVLGPDGVEADGGPDAVLIGPDAERLAARGVWVPGFEPRITRRARTKRDTLGAAGTAPAALLSADDLAVARGRRRAARTVAEHLEVRVLPGRLLGVDGTNGSGKSTLALTLAGLLPPAAGRLSASPAFAAGAGAAPWRWGSRQLAQRIGTAFQEPGHAFVAGTVRGEVASATGGAAAAGALLERVGLAHLADVSPFTLSGGEQRRLGLAAALATRPGVLVLDEPTAGQDARTWAAVADLVDEAVASGTGVVAVSHDAAFLDQVADERIRVGA